MTALNQLSNALTKETFDVGLVKGFDQRYLQRKLPTALLVTVPSKSEAHQFVDGIIDFFSRSIVGSRARRRFGMGDLWIN